MCRLRHCQQHLQQLRRLTGFENASRTVNDRWNSIIRQCSLDTDGLRVVVHQDGDVPRLDFPWADFRFTGQQ